MSGPDFATSQAKLHGLIDAIQRSWTEAREQWDDATSRNLDEQHLRPIVRQLTEIIEATVPLSDVAAQARRACGPEKD